MLTQALVNLSPLAAVALLAAFILGGSVKGALGIGIPLVVVPLTAQFLELPAAVGLVTVPMFATNIGQALESGGTLPALRRLWPMLVTIVVGTWVGVHLLISIDRRLLNGVVGAVLVGLAVWLFRQPRLGLSASAERWAGPAVGLMAGTFGGLSGMFGPPLIAYLVGLGIHPDLFVKYISILFLAATGTLLLALGGTGTLTLSDLTISAATMVPIQFGVVIGRWLRGRCRPALFRGLVLGVLACGGIDMLRPALF